MAHLILGEHPDGLTVRLVHGDGMTLAATLTDAAGAEIDWSATPSLEFAGPDHDAIATHVATIDGPTASWQLTRAQVDTIWTASLDRYGNAATTYVRALLPDGDDGSVEYAGRVAWSDGWTAGTQVQVKTFTRPVPVSTAGGGSDSLIIVNGGTVTLDDAKAEGSLVSYRVKSSAEFTAASGTATLTPGAYTFERTNTGWIYYAATGTVFGGDLTPPSAVTNLVTTGGEGQIVLTWSASTGEPHYRYRVWRTSEGASGAWITTDAITATVTALPAGAYTAEVYAYSNGGSTTATTATATVTAPSGWNTIGTDSFSDTNGTSLYSRATPVGGLVWSGDSEPIVVDGKLMLTAPDSAAAVTLTFPAATSASGVEVTVDYLLYDQVDSSLADLMITFEGPNGAPDVRLKRIDNDDVKIRVSGYDTAPSPDHQFGPVIVAPTTGTPTSGGQSGTVTVRKVGNILSVLDGSGSVLTSVDLTNEWTGYSNKPTPGNVVLTLRGFQRSTINAVTVKALT